MNNEGQRRPGGLSHVHLRHRNANANASPLFIVWCEQNRNQIAKKRRFVLPARYGANESWARPKAISRLVRSCTISSLVAAEREVI